MSPPRIAVCLEVNENQSFASALDWPGWSRAGRDEVAALEALSMYAQRYAPVAQNAAIPFPSTIRFNIVERVAGGKATAFAAPECRRPFPQVTVQSDHASVTSAAGRRQADLVIAAWAIFDEIAAAAPDHLRKGPRGGGRDRRQVVGHVLNAETAFARKLGIKPARPDPNDRSAKQEIRASIAAVLRAPSDGSRTVEGGWTTRYAARRIAWHVLEHAWEMQDRT